MVGVTAYYPTEADALATTNIIGSNGVYTVASVGGYSYWRLASNSTGSSSQATVYGVGDVLNSDGAYKLYPAGPCFLEGTKILCQVDGVDTYVPIETIKPGTLVKTLRDGYKATELTAKYVINNPGTTGRLQNRLYKCSPLVYPELKTDLYLTGCHSILVGTLTEKQREETIKQLSRIFITDNRYRLMACIDERAEPWNSEGSYTVWHIVLENVDPKMNYGIYAEGLLVESCSLFFVKNRSNMTVS
jgi:hypothetical protein